MPAINNLFSLLITPFLFLPLFTQAEIIINEVDADTQGIDTAEFIELYDGGKGNTALDNFALVLFNGSNDTSYRALDLEGQKTNPNGYFVICGDATAVANCDLTVSPVKNIIQNGADAIALFEDKATHFPNGTAVTTLNLVDAIVYDTNDSDDTALLALLNASEPQINEKGKADAENHSNQRCNNGSGGARNTSNYTQAFPTPGTANRCKTQRAIGQCGAASTWISTIQGDISTITNDKSPMLGAAVVVEAIVTTDLQGGILANGEYSSQYRGYWLQEEAADYDDKPSTSEGIRVLDKIHDVKKGDKVRLKATVSEVNHVTQLSDVSDMILCSTDNALPPTQKITLPVEHIEILEALEGMRVSFDQSLVVSDLYGTQYGLGNYGQFAVSTNYLFSPTEIATPGSTAYQAALDARRLNYLLIDDGVSTPYPAFIPFPDAAGFSATNPLRIGDQVSRLSGVLNAYRDTFIVIPDQITIEPTNPRTNKPIIASEANLVIAGMNVLNYFNGDGQGGGFPTSRGAPTQAAFEMQQAKIIAALDAINADIIALMEIENDGYANTSAIADLVNALNAMQTNENTYRFIQPDAKEKIGTDAIAVGLLYRHKKITPTGQTIILDSTNSPSDNQGILFNDRKNRPSLIQSFRFNDFSFTLSVNHLKSKGSACNEPDEGDNGQGNCNISRTRAAQGLVRFLQTTPTGIDTAAIMILGDINAYSQEDPIKVFEQAGFTNLKYTNKSTEEKPFSYSFGGFLGSLDHALATDSLSDKIVSIDAWHINSVEDSLMDYLTEVNGHPHPSIDHYANNDPYRSSDHDPLIIGLNIKKEAPDTPNSAEMPKIPVTNLGSFNMYLIIGLVLLSWLRRQ